MDKEDAPFFTNEFLDALEDEINRIYGGPIAKEDGEADRNNEKSGKSGA